MTPFAIKPNIDEVARRAGVTRSTVSKAFSPDGRYFVSQKTKDLVFKIAQEIGYEPNVAARRMIAGRSRVIALLEHESWSLLNSVNDPSLLAADRFSGAHDVTYAAGYDLLPLTVKVDHSEQKRLLKMYLGQHFDGILCVAPHLPTPEFFGPLLDQGCIIVTDSNLISHPNLLTGPSWLASLPFYDTVLPHLAAQGRKHFICLAPANFQYRITGVHLTFWDGLDLSNSNMLSSLTELMKSHPETDAIVTPDDLRGWKIYQGLKQLGYQVPEQITIAALSDFRQPLKPLPIHLLVQAPVTFATRKMARQLIARLEPERLPQVDKMQFPEPCQPAILENSAEQFRALAAQAEKLETLRATHTACRY